MRRCWIRPRPARAAARHGDRRLPHRSGRGAVRDRRPAREVHGVRGPCRRRPAAGSARLRRQRRSTGAAGGREALAVHHVADPLEGALEKQGMAELYATIENPLVRVLAKMEHVGIAVDADELRSINVRLIERGRAARRRAAGASSAATSQPQLADPAPRDAVHRTRAGAGKKTKTGFSTDAATLEKLRDQWPEFIDPLLQYREVEKLRSTYGEGLLAEVAADGRIHATFNQTVARTGRLSSDSPTCTTSRSAARRADCSARRSCRAPAHELLVADYNQIELRCIAHLAADPGLIEAFASGQDIHNATAARVFAVDPAAVTLDQRSKAKMVSYGLAYGMESYGLGQRLGIPTEEAAVILDAYFVAFPNVKAYMDATVIEARKVRLHRDAVRPPPADPRAAQLELADPPGRRAAGDERRHPGPRRRHLQGRAWCASTRRSSRVASASRLMLQVHDEVLVEVPTDEREEVGRARHPADARRRRARRPARGQRRVGPHLGRRQDLMAGRQRRRSGMEGPCGGGGVGPDRSGGAASHWFEPVAEHLGAAYLRYSFTKGTPQEVDYLVDALGLRPGQRVLDVGCGPGRHASELARRGMLVHGIDISARFIELARRDAPDGATFERLDARELRVRARVRRRDLPVSGRFRSDGRRAATTKQSWPASPGRSYREGVLALSRVQRLLRGEVPRRGHVRRRNRCRPRAHRGPQRGGGGDRDRSVDPLLHPARAALDPRSSRPRRRSDQQRRARRVRVGAAHRGVPRVPGRGTPGLKFRRRAIDPQGVVAHRV